MTMSLDAFGAWALSRRAVGNPGTNSYKGQCVSLVQQYLYQCYGIPYKPRGNAASFVPPEFTRVRGGLQKGDIVRYAGASWNGGFGHIGIIDVNGKFLDQNGTKRFAVAYRDQPFAGISAIFRPNRRCRLYDAPQAPSHIGGAVAQNGTFSAYENRNIRRMPSLQGEVVAVFSAGAKQRYDSYIDAAGFRWVSWVGASGHRNYVAVKRLSDGKRYGRCY